MASKILLIDDDPLVLQSFKKLLVREGYEVIPVSSCEEALTAIKQKEFDLIVSDIRMPGKDGIATTKEIQEMLIASGKKDLPVIFITGYSGDEMKLQAPLVGETLYKPVDIERLLTAVRDYL